MHVNTDETAALGPDQRRHAVARVLAAGILRLHARAALPSSAELPAARILPEKAGYLLDDGPETRLLESSS